MREVLIGLVVIFAVFMGLLFIAYHMERAECRAKWESSTFEHRYSFFGGCQISKDGKIWLPSENYREISE